MTLEGLQLGQYRLLRLLGSGGMGEVYLAEDARINQQVALKVSRTEATPYPNNSMAQDAVRLFQREAKVIARLDHPHILPLFNYGEENVNGTRLIYIVMPYRREGSFVNWLQQGGDNEMLSVQDIAYLIHQAADALQYAHDNQVIHQDVKPSNFLIRINKEHPKLPDLLLADFGIARLSNATASISHSIRGTPIYMAPEQWNGEPVYATDQYALAVFAYELLADRSPFAGRQEQVMYQHFHVQPPPPSAFNPRLSKAIDAVILKALAKRPEERFPSISSFANAFQEATRELDASTIIKVSHPLQRSDHHALPVASPSSSEKTVPSSIRGNEAPLPRPISFVSEEAELHHSQPIIRQQGVSTGTAILLVGLAFLLIVGGLGIFYLYNSINHPSSTSTGSGTNNQVGESLTASATSITQTSNPGVSSPAAFTATPTSSLYVQLKSYYSGSASGYADGAVTFTLKSEDQQGNVSMQTTFQQLGGSQKTAIYSCQGSVSTDRSLNLQCSDVADPSYVLTVHGSVFPDGHMEGTETATNTNNSSYNHVYSWKVY